MLHVLLVGLHLLLFGGMPSVRGENARNAGRESFRITGAVEKAEDWSAARLTQTFEKEIRTVPYTLKGQKAEARCLPLLTLIETAKPKTDPKQKNHMLAFVVIVRAEDGYTISFSLGELLPAYGKRQVWIALDKDGKPLPDKEMPVHLLVTEDEKPSRWVSGVASIVVIDGVPLAR